MLAHRIELEPFNLFATVVFILAILHSFSTSWFNKKAEHYHHLFEEKKIKGLVDPMATSMMAGLLHFCGEIEAVFGIWTIVLGIGTTFYYDWHTFVEYVSSARYVEPLLIIVIMTMASSRPILKLFELILWRVVKLFGGSLEAWWFTILTLGPLLGSFITEPAAMVVTAMLLSEKFFVLNPSKKIKYGMLSLLLVNISIGGTLSNFASPPILMVAGAWDWSNAFMLLNFGWKAILAITLNNVFFFFLFKKELLGLKTSFETNQYQKYIQRKFISKKKLETIFDSEEHKIDESLGFTDRFLQVSADIKEKIKSEAMDVLSDEELIRYNISHTLDQRFENIKLDEMKRTIPGLLPNEQRPLYRDPNWNSRDDKVPYWIMAMHIFFMLCTLETHTNPFSLSLDFSFISDFSKCLHFIRTGWI
nr:MULTISPECIES: putative Na+/H+ antiporter [unclassified Fusibacter]